MSNRIFILVLLFAATLSPRAEAESSVLKAEDFKHYVDEFNKTDRELYPSYIPNSGAWDFLKANVPLLDCPDRELQQIYYFRWWTYRKHIAQAPDGFIITEFLPAVGWAGKFNSICCAAGHHFREGRWLADPKFLNDYARFWFGKDGNPRSYSFWAADSLWSDFLVTGDDKLIQQLLPDLVKNYRSWESTHRDANGLYWQTDNRDGMEISISGALTPKADGYRATINSYQFGDAIAIAKMAEHFGQTDLAKEFAIKGAELKRLVQEKLWDPDAQFFKVLPRKEGSALSDARELHGYTPWYFDLPDADRSVAWKQLMDPKGFYARFGLTTAEQRHPKFAISYKNHECQWNGPSWPFATAITLTAMANLLDDYKQDAVSASDYVQLLRIYAHAQHRTLEDGTVLPWIDENQNPFIGDWIARTRLKTFKNGTWDPGNGGEERGKDYNHSTFCDLIINGLIGLRPRADNTVELSPLLPAETWDYFCLDQIRYHGHWLTILFDKDGSHYRRGAGFRLFSGGVQIAISDRLQRLTATLPIVEAESSGGWMKSPDSPVIGGKYGTCFDVSVLKDKDGYRMWLSWRSRKSIAVVQSKDGIHWSEPPQVVLEPRQETGWRDDINRPIVLKREDGYHMWYTGQANGKSAIGYAISLDGLAWKRMSDVPVLRAQQPWEKGAVMNPDVIWDDAGRQYRMWYSAGTQYEPDAIGYATSADGLVWTKEKDSPIFTADPHLAWESNRVAGCQVIQQDDGFLMFYIGYRDIDHAQIGVARSKDGVTKWQRLAANPIVRAVGDRWDGDACYKPFAIFDGHQWLLWYNGRKRSLEQIGVAVHEGKNLGFDDAAE